MMILNRCSSIEPGRCYSRLGDFLRGKPTFGQASYYLRAEAAAESVALEQPPAVGSPIGACAILTRLAAVAVASLLALTARPSEL